MKPIYLIQIFNLSTGIITIERCAFRQFSDADAHVHEVKRIYSELDELSLEELGKKYVFNILKYDLY